MMTTHTDFARPVDRTLYEAPGRPAPSPLGHAAAVPAGAPVSVTPRKPEDVRTEDNARTLARIEEKALDNPVDRALHEAPLPIGFDAAPAPTPAPLPGAPASFASVPGLPDVMRPATPAAAPLPGLVPATAYDPWRPLQHLPAPAPISPPRPLVAAEGHGSLDADLAAAQFATVATSRAKLDRARSYAARLGTHAAEIRAKLAASSARGALAAIGRTEPDPADLGPARGELIGVERQHRQAVAALADIEAEHARHEADLAALTGSDGAARAILAEAHAARALAQTAADAAKAILDRATVHRGTVNLKLSVARGEEAQHDADATARLRAALADGDVPPAAAEPLSRVSGALEDDLRAATAAVDALTAEHVAKVAALTSAHRAVLGAVDGVLMVDAEQVARELHAADERALALRTRLHCFAKRTPGDWVRPPVAPPKMMPGGWLAADPAASALPPPIRSTAAIGQAIASAPPPASTGSFVTNWTTETSAWDAYASALTADPQAVSAFADRPPSPPAPPLPVRAA